MTFNPTTLTKSRFVQAVECPRKLDYARDRRYLDQRDDNDFMAMLAEGGHQVGALARLMFPEGRLVWHKSADEQAAFTAEGLCATDTTLFEGTIRHGNLLVRCDVLRKRGNELQLIEVKAKGYDPAEGRFMSTRKGNPILSEWRPYLYDVAFQAYVLSLAYPHLRVTPYLMLLDKSVTVQMDGLNARLAVQVNGRDVTVQVSEDFDIARLSPSVLRLIDVSEEISRLRAYPVETAGRGAAFEDFVTEISSGLKNGVSFPGKVGAGCKKCQFYADPKDLSDSVRSGWAECMVNAKGPDAPRARDESVFSLYRLHPTSLDKLLDTQPLRLADVEESSLEAKSDSSETIDLALRRYLQWQEATSALTQPFMRTAALQAELRQWRWPLHFIDFETSRPALPYHSGRTPYDQILFQFSHHVLESDGKLSHRTQCIEVAPGIPPSVLVLRALAKALSNDDGTVVHWWTHERTVLADIQRQIAQDGAADAAQLIAFVDSMTGSKDQPGRLRDLGMLVSRIAFYPGTSGSSSIKKVLPAALQFSPEVRRHYGRLCYGTADMPSLNFRNWQWVFNDGDTVRDPYELLDPLFAEATLQRATTALEDDDAGAAAEFISNGGAALIAYDQLQQPSLSDSERQRLLTQLLRYCELDTLAMVMVYQSLTGHGLTE